MNMKYVTDGKEVFHKYYFDNNNEIHNCKTNQKLTIYQDKYGYKIAYLYSDNGGRSKGKSLNKLIRETLNSKQETNNYIDVFGFEDKYCFNPQNPFEIYLYRCCRKNKKLPNRLCLQANLCQARLFSFQHRAL